MMSRETKVGSGGFVRYDEHMGSDESIVKKARVSSGRGFVSWKPYKRCTDCNSCFLLENGGPIGAINVPQCPHMDFEHFRRGDQGLINYMMEHRHTSPFEFGEITFHLRIPMHIWRQVVRHRTANVQEYSTRYAEAIDELETTRPDAWRKQGDSNRQGSVGLIEKGTSSQHGGFYLTQREHEFHEFAREIYAERLKLGVAREQARKDLPLSNYTEVYWKLDSHNLFHFLGLRLDQHAQLEAQQFAQGIGSVVKELFPHCYEAFEEYKLFAVTFSRTEIQLLRDLCSQAKYTLTEPLREDPESIAMKFSKRELKSFLDKIGISLEQSNAPLSKDEPCETAKEALREFHPGIDV